MQVWGRIAIVFLAALLICVDAFLIKCTTKTDP